jgi:hypothetical protein
MNFLYVGSNSQKCKVYIDALIIDTENNKKIATFHI